MVISKESIELSELRILAKKEGIPPENIIEINLPETEIEDLKSHIRKETKNNCYFFIRPENGKAHVIAFVNIENIAEIFERMELRSVFNAMNYSSAR